MKKYISFILIAVISLSSIAVNSEENTSETTEAAGISVEIIENSVFEENIQESEISEKNTNFDESQAAKTEDIDSDSNDIESDFEEDNSTAEIMSLDTGSSDIWEAVANMGTQRADGELVSVNGEMYAIGGMGNSGYLNTIEKYNSANNVWQTVTEIPGAPKGFGVVSNGSKIYIVGGYGNSDYLSAVQAYDVNTNVWNSITPMKEQRDQAAVLCMDNKIYVFGGRNKDGFVNSYEYYNLSDNTWNKVTTGFDESMIRVGAHAQYISGYVCIYGGIDKSYSTAGVDMYLSSSLIESQEIIGDDYDSISIAWGADKAMIFEWDRANNAYDIHEMTVNDGDISLSDIIFTNTSSACKYSEYIIYNGYLYAVGGYNLTSKRYLETVNKYSVYYGDYTIGDGTINSTVTSDGNSITLNVEAGREYMLFINAKNTSSFNGYTFKLEYPADVFTVIDGCALTAEKETNAGGIAGTDIAITECTSHGVSFVCTEELSGAEAVTKSVNAVLLKANASGQRTIKYSMVQE